jgi:hypothetical protein
MNINELIKDSEMTAASDDKETLDEYHKSYNLMMKVVKTIKGAIKGEDVYREVMPRMSENGPYKGVITIGAGVYTYLESGHETIDVVCGNQRYTVKFPDSYPLLDTKYGRAPRFTTLDDACKAIAEWIGKKNHQANLQIKTVKNVKEAKKFFLGNSEGTVRCLHETALSKATTICKSFPDAEEFFKTAKANR